MAVGELGRAFIRLIPVVDKGAVGKELEASGTAAGQGWASRFEKGATPGGSRAGRGFSSAFSSELNKGVPTWGKFGAKAGDSFAGKFGGALGQITRATAKVGGIALIAAGAASIAFSVKFQAAMERVHTQAGASQKDVGLLSKQILDMRNAQQGPLELAAAMFHLKSVGLSNVDAMKALRAASDLAAVGGSKLEDTTNAIAGAWRSGIKGAQSFGQAAATVNAIVGAGNVKMEDLIQALGTGILPSARTFGVSLKSVGAALALMTDEGIPAVVAATRLRMSLSLLGAPSQVAEKWLGQIGVTGLALANKMRGPGGLVAAIGYLKDHLDKSGLSLSKQAILLSHAFGGGRSSSAILTLINNYSVFQRKQEQINSSLGKFSGAIVAQRKTAQAQLHLLTASLETIAVKVGTAVLPVITKFLNLLISSHAVIPLLATGLAVITAALIVQAVAWVALNIASAGIIAALALLIIGVVALATHWRTVWGFVLKITKDVWGWVKTHWPLLLVVLAGPIGLAALEIIRHWGAIKAGFLDVYHFLLPGFRVIGKIAQVAFLVISTAAKIAFHIVYGVALLAWTLIRVGFLRPLEVAAIWLFRHVIAPVSKATWGSIAKDAQIAWGIIHPVLTFLGKVAKVIFDSMKKTWHDTWQSASAFFSVTVSIVKGLIKGLWDRILQVFGFIINGAAKAFGWVPGLGPQLKMAASNFNKFRDNVNRALGGVNGRTVTVGVAFAQAQTGHQGPSLSHRATGGEIRGPGGPADDKAGLYALSNREWVIRANSASRYGNQAMRAVNEGRAVIGYAKGGQVGPVGQGISVRPELPAQSVINSVVNAAVEALARKWATTFGGGPGAAAIVADAMRWIGRIPYVWGGTAVPGGADCSGFVQTIYGRHGIAAPRTSEAQGAWVRQGPPVPGGLALYNSPAGGPPPGHVAIIGRGGMVISQGGGLGPQYVPLNSMPLMFTGIPPRGFDQGGWLQPGWTAAYNGTGRPERVVPPSGSHSGPLVSIGELHVRESADVDLIAQRLAFLMGQT